MKRSDALQLAVVLVGVVMGLLTLQYILSSLYAVFLWLFSNGNEMMSPLLTIFAVAGLQALFCWLMITRSEPIAAFIRKRSGLKDGVKIISRPNDLLYILLIVLAFFLLLTNITPLLTTIIESFRKKSSPNLLDQFSDQRPINWIPLILDVLLPLIVLMAGRPIANYFAKAIGEEQMSIEEEPSSSENTETKED